MFVQTQWGLLINDQPVEYKVQTWRQNVTLLLWKNRIELKYSLCDQMYFHDDVCAIMFLSLGPHREDVNMIDTICQHLNHFGMQRTRWVFF